MSVHRSWSAAIASVGVAMALMLGAGSAQARSDVSWSIGIGVPGVVVGASNVGMGYYAPAPVVVPAPVYRVPAPVYYAPPPVVYAPPVYYAPRPYRAEHHRRAAPRRGHHRNWR